MVDEGSLHQKPNVVEDVMDDEGSLHQRPCEVCITVDVESIDLKWFENTKPSRMKNGTRCLLHVGVYDWESLGTSPSRIQRGFCETVAEVMDTEVEGEDEIHPSKRPRVAPRPRSSHRIAILTTMNFFGQVRILLSSQFSGTAR